MRFCDFFIDYTISIKDIKSSIPFNKLPLYKKIAIVLVFVFTVGALMALATNRPILAFIVFGIAIMFLIVFAIIDSSKKNLKIMLSDYYIPYSKKRMDIMIKLLNKYNIKIDDKEKIDLLILEAKKAQKQSDYLLTIKKPLKTLGTIIIPIIVYIIQLIRDKTSTEDMLSIAIQTIIILICGFAIIMAILPSLKAFFYRDYNKYNELIDDLSQIKLFY